MDIPIALLNNENVAIGLSLLLALYADDAKIKLPNFIRELFANPVFRIVILSLLLIHDFNKAPHIALTVALAFTWTMHLISKQELEENFEYFSNINRLN